MVQELLFQNAFNACLYLMDLQLCATFRKRWHALMFYSDEEELDSSQSAIMSSLIEVMLCDYNLQPLDNSTGNSDPVVSFIKEEVGILESQLQWYKTSQTHMS